MCTTLSLSYLEQGWFVNKVLMFSILDVIILLTFHILSTQFQFWFVCGISQFLNLSSETDFFMDLEHFLGTLWTGRKVRNAQPTHAHTCSQFIVASLAICMFLGGGKKSETLKELASS